MMVSAPTSSDLSSVLSLIAVLSDPASAKALIAQMGEHVVAAQSLRDETAVLRQAAANDHSEADRLRAAIADREAEIATRAAALDARARTLQDRENSIAAREQKTAAANEDLARREASLADQQQKLSAAKSAFEAQIAKLSELRQAAQ